MKKRNYYQVLNLQPTATEAEIKKAYRRMAMKDHPDRNPGDQAAEERFKEAKQAAEVLTDAQMRTVYDRLGISEKDRFDPNTGGVRPDNTASSKAAYSRTKSPSEMLQDVLHEMFIAPKIREQQEAQRKQQATKQRDEHLARYGTMGGPDKPLISISKSHLMTAFDGAINAHNVQADKIDRQDKKLSALVGNFDYTELTNFSETGALPPREVGNNTIIHLTPTERIRLGVKGNEITLSKLDRLSPVKRDFYGTEIDRQGFLEHVLADPLHPLKGMTANRLLADTKRHDISAIESRKREFTEALAARRTLGQLRTQKDVLQKDIPVLQEIRETIAANPADQIYLLKDEGEKLKDFLDRAKASPGIRPDHDKHGSEIHRYERFDNPFRKNHQERSVENYGQPSQSNLFSPSAPQAQQAPEKPSQAQQTQSNSSRPAGGPGTPNVRRQQLNKTLSL